VINVDTSGCLRPAAAYHIVECIHILPDGLLGTEFLCCVVPFMLGPAATVGSGDLPVFTTIEIR
jgi:hypothetical protein